MSISATTGITTSNSSAGTSLATPSFVASAAQDVLVAVAIANTSAAVSSVTDTAGNAYSLISSQTNSGSVRVEFWAAPTVIGNASNVVTVTLSSSSLMAIAVEEYAGLTSGGLAPLSRAGWTCTASSNVFGSAGQPTGAVGGTNGPWITNPHPQWIVVDMGSAQSFNGLQITPNQSNAIGQAYTLDVSDNGSTWTSTGESISGLPATVTLQQWALSASYTHRYFRINVTADNGFVSMASIFPGTVLAARSTRFVASPYPNLNTSNGAEVAVPVAYSGDWSVGAFGIVTSSGDTITAGTGTLRRSVVPALTSVSVALVDFTAAASLNVSLSSIRAWASVGCDLVSDGTVLPVPTGANNAATLTNAGAGAKHQTVKGPAAITFTPSTFTPVPVASQLKGGTTGTAYSETITAKGARVRTRSLLRAAHCRPAPA